MPRQSASATNPLPSLLRASAFDAANMRMMGDGRKVWDEDDYNIMCETQERLITACYSRDGDTDPHIKYIRFSLAEQLERQGSFNLRTDFRAVLDWIDEYLAAPAEQAA